LGAATIAFGECRSGALPPRCRDRASDGVLGESPTLDRMTTAEIVDRIDSRLVALEREIASLQAARAERGQGERAAPVASAKRRPDADGATTAKRSPSPRRQQPASGRSNGAVSAETLIALLSGSAPLSTAALADQLGADRDEVLAFLRELERAGRVRRLGQRRATRWRAFSDEDWIAQRAAELATRSRSAR
jgi:hypothetical protein